MNTTELSPAEYSAAFLVDFLSSVGVLRAELTFSGCGDSGAVDDVQFVFRQKREPTETKVEKGWRLALARHHLLYPEHSLAWFESNHAPRPKLGTLVENYFDHFINPSLGDWVNNDGGSGSVTVDVEERLITHEVSYNDVKDGEPQTGTVEQPELFGALLDAARPLGIVAIEADLDFDCENVSWSDTFTSKGADGNPVKLESPQENALAKAWRDIVGARLHDARFDSEDFCALLTGLYEIFVKKTALDYREDDSEGYSISLRLAQDEGRTVLEWTATFRFMDSDDGDSGEIVAPVICAPRPSRRKRAAA